MSSWNEPHYRIPIGNDDYVSTSILEVEEVFEFGADKHGPQGFERGTVSVSRHFFALLRHLWKAYLYEEKDPETGKSHWAHAMCRLLMIMYQKQKLKETDDSPLNIG